MTHFLLYAVSVLIWGSSWLGITFQLGVVAPEVSVVYRFAASSSVLLAFCLVTGRSLRFGARDQAFIALQGVLLFSVNYFLIYLGTQYLTSGLVAVAFSTVVAMNIVNGALFFAQPVRPRVAVGAGFGLVGLTIVFWPEVAAFDVSHEGTLGLVLVLGGALSASFGMLVSARNQRHGLPVVQTNTYGMAYGCAFTALFAVLRGRAFDFDPSLAYVASLAYLACLPPCSPSARI